MEGTEHTDTDTQQADATDIISQGQAQASGPCIWDCTLCSQHCTINDKVETWNETGQATLFLLITSNKSIYNQTQWFSMRDISEFVLRHPAVAKGKQLNKKNIEKKLRDAINTNRSGIFLKKKSPGGGHFAFSLSDPNAALAYFTFVDGYQPFIPAITIDMTILNDSSGNISVDNTTGGNDNSATEGLDIGSSAVMNVPGDEDYRPTKKRGKSFSSLGLSPNSNLALKKHKCREETDIELIVTAEDGTDGEPKTLQAIGSDMQKHIAQLQQYMISLNQNLSTLHSNFANTNEIVIGLKASTLQMLQVTNELHEENMDIKQRLKKVEAELAQYTGANVMMGMNIAHDSNTAAIVINNAHANSTNVTHKDDATIDE